MFSYYFLVFHVILLFLSLVYFTPKKDDNGYTVLFEESFPVFYQVYFWFILIDVFYVMANLWFIYYIYIDQFNDLLSIMLIMILAAVIFFLIYSKFKGEILYPTDEVKNRKKHIVVSIILYIYAASVLFSIMILHSVNHFLDFRPKTEYKVTVQDFYYQRGNKRGYFMFLIDPPVCGLNKIEVSNTIYNEAEKGKTLKLFVCKGLLGQKYFSKKMEWVK